MLTSVLAKQRAIMKVPSRLQLSSLAAIINSGVRPKSAASSRPSVGLFGLDQLREPIGFETLTEKALSTTEYLRQKVINLPKQTTKSNVVELFDEMSDSLCQVADMAEFVRLAHPDADFRRAAQNSCAKIGRYVEELNTDLTLYRSFKQELGKLSDPTDIRVGQLFLIDFEQSGIHLADDRRSDFVTACERVHTLGSIFQQHVDMPTIVDSTKLPVTLGASLSRYFTYDSQTNALAIDRFLADSPDRNLRETSYRLFYAKNEQVDDVIKHLMTERQSLAQLSGFDSFATRTISPNTLAGSIDFVSEVVQRVSDATRPASERELAKISAAMKSDGITQPVAPWDVIHYAKKIRHELADEEVNYRQLRDYFSLGSALAGLDKLFSNLYGVHLKLETPQNGELWADEVIKVSVVATSSGQTLGHIYLDLFERPQKPIMECHFTIRGGRSLPNGNYQTPVVVLMLNFSAPSKGHPAFLALGQIENLFHEFGHAMHSVLGRTKYQHVTGTRCPTDFAEVPSVLMESFANDPRVAAMYATHYETGKPAPAAALHSALTNMRSAFRLVDLQQQLIYTDFDLTMHNQRKAPVTDISGLYAKIWKHHSGVEMPSELAQYQRFAHLVGYGSRYYSYLLSRAVAGLLWRQMFADDPLCLMSSSGGLIRKRLLEHGGMVEPRRLVESTLGVASLSAKDVANAIVNQTLQGSAQAKADS